MRHLAECQAGNLRAAVFAERLNLLTVREMAGVLVCHCPLEPPMWSSSSMAARNSVTSFISATKRWAFVVVFGIIVPSSSSYSFSVDPQPAALVMMASKLPLQIGVDVACAPVCAHLRQAGVDVQRTAAILRFRDHHLAAVLLQDAHRGLIQTGEGIRWRCNRREMPRDSGVRPPPETSCRSC